VASNVNFIIWVKSGISAYSTDASHEISLFQNLEKHQSWDCCLHHISPRHGNPKSRKALVIVTQPAIVSHER